MTTLTPTVSIRFQAQKVAQQAPTTALLVAPLGSAASVNPSEPFKVQSLADAIAKLGVTDANELVAAWFDLGLEADIDLYAVGLDTAGWLAETWETTFAGTAKEAGTLVWRAGMYTLNITVAKGDTAAAVATKLAAAITASMIPYTAVVNGGVPEQVDIATLYRGLHTQRIAPSIDLYRDRGEFGVDGITSATVAQATGAGSPTFDAAAFAVDYDWVIHWFRPTAFVDALEAHIESGWQDRSFFAHALVGMQGDQASVVAFGDLRNDRHTSYVATSDSPDLEAVTSVAMLASIRDAVETHGTPNISGQGERHPVPIRPFTVTHDSEALLQAGVTPLRASATTVTAVRFVANYREDTLLNEDLSQFDIGTVLSLIETGNRLKAEFQRHLGKAIVADGTPLSSIIAAVAISSEQLVGVVGEVLKGLWRDAILYGADEATIEQVVTSVTVLETGGRANGYQVVLDPTIVRRVIFLQALVRYL